MNSEYITCGDEEHFGPACPVLQDPSGAVPDLAVDFSTYSGGFCVVSDYSGFFGSLKTNLELTTGTTLLPKSWQIGNYAQAWNSANFARFTWNSVFISIFTTLGTLFIGTMAAYAVASRFLRETYICCNSVLHAVHLDRCCGASAAI